ncbi:TetR/AcrR family transcriptional regulator [Schumannella sp. 10F1B-5-1]|uniref:TetR/AcrR family transcriptional regulator n=1 Tax=Schumannella sp. 10F1B-5-1 TaxID=2590780 RepID=UPI0011303420|nr:helix-turn-helix domain-containing protein [Schumannella sp. 10F1B-5-1]TPW76875.1 helix-turn-helix transcriptional regulator [Schumannella sp. 10F1B-5-1]
MPRTAPRGGPQTRVRIAEAASPLFAERGFDDVTVAEIARAAGVSSVTVFKHFPRKEDLFFDRTVDAEELLREAVRDRADGVSALDALRDALLALADERAPLSGLAHGSPGFYRTVADSPALQARALEIGAALQALLAAELAADERFEGDAVLLAAFVLQGYATVLIGTAQRVLAGAGAGTGSGAGAGAVDFDAIAADHRTRVEALFAAIRAGVRVD